MLSAAIKNKILSHKFLIMLQFNLLSTVMPFPFYIMQLYTHTHIYIYTGIQLEMWCAMHTDHDQFHLFQQLCIYDSTFACVSQWQLARYKRSRVDNGGVHVKTHLELILYLRLHVTHSSFGIAARVVAPILKAKYVCIQGIANN